MNVTAYIKMMGISKATFYRRISEAGIELNDIRGADGNLTDEGLSVLSSLFDGTSHKRLTSQTRERPTDDATRRPVDETMRRSTDETISYLQSQLETTRAELAEARAQITSLLQLAADREREHAEAWRRYAEAQQQIETQRLLATRQGTQGIFSRLITKLTGKD